LAGNSLPLNIAELQVSGEAYVKTTEPCPPIAGGEGSVVTASNERCHAPNLTFADSAAQLAYTNAMANASKDYQIRLPEISKDESVAGMLPKT
jgi:hypothetical protein